jgi:hypothetical protein
LVSSGQASLNPARGYVDAAFATGAMGNAILQFDSRSRYNPFEPQFFSGITIPQSLFNTAPQPVDQGSTDDAVPIEILKRWLERDPIAEEILVSNRGRDLPAPLRLQIQQFLQSTNDYTGQLDGIFGSLTAQALVNWRAAYEQGI